MSDIFMALKSTMDRQMNDLAQSLSGQFPGIDFSEIDDTVDTEPARKTSAPCLLYSVSSPTETPRAPLYSAMVAVGVKTVQDKGNYTLSEILTILTDTFKAGYRLQLLDYSATSGQPVPRGTMLVTKTNIDYQKFDSVAGVRMIAMQVRIVEHV